MRSGHPVPASLPNLFAHNGKIDCLVIFPREQLSRGPITRRPYSVEKEHPTNCKRDMMVLDIVQILRRGYEGRYTEPKIIRLRRKIIRSGRKPLRPVPQILRSGRKPLRPVPQAIRSRRKLLMIQGRFPKEEGKRPCTKSEQKKYYCFTNRMVCPSLTLRKYIPEAK